MGDNVMHQHHSDVVLAVVPKRAAVGSQQLSTIAVFV
jgi:hypothetical protein